MGGGLMQLVAYGAQDIYLTGNPQITFFKVVYKRYTNFSMESIQQTLNGTSSIGVGGRLSATIARNGDLLYKTFIVLPPMTQARPICSEYGHQIIKSVEVEIGGQTIDKHYGDFMEAWTELTEPNPTGSVAFLNSQFLAGGLNNTGFNASNTLTTSFLSNLGGAAGNMAIRNASSVFVNNFTQFQRMACCGGVGAYCGENGGTDSVQILQELSIPLRFWFCKEPGLALPLIALQYHEVNIIIDFAPALQHESPELWCDYIYLDTDERRRFAQVSHEYLIEQLQVNTFPSAKTTQDYKLTFNHPVKELIWYNLSSKFGDNNIAHNILTFYSIGSTNSGGSSLGWNVNNQLTTLKLNGQERFAPRRTDYFTKQQPYLYHTSRGLDRSYMSPYAYDDTTLKYNTIAVYSFALRPEEHQPSGTCNFSRIDSAILNITNGTCPRVDLEDDNPPIFKVYAINYNILRIMSGMGGLAYSN